VYWIKLKLILVEINIMLDRALEFLTGYLIEKSLSADKILVFLLIFTYFQVSQKVFLILSVAF
jgi:tellurite resistance protein TerC